MWSAKRKLPEFSIPSRARSLVRSSAYTGSRWNLRSATRRRGIDCETRVRLGRRSDCCCIFLPLRWHSHVLDTVLGSQRDEPALPTEGHTSGVSDVAVLLADAERSPEVVLMMI